MQHALVKVEDFHNLSAEEINLCITRCLCLLNSLLDENEVMTRGRVTAHGPLVKGSVIDILISNNVRGSPTKGSKLPLEVFSTDTIPVLRKQVSVLVEADVRLIVSTI